MVCVLTKEFGEYFLISEMGRSRADFWFCRRVTSVALRAPSVTLLLENNPPTKKEKLVLTNPTTLDWRRRKWNSNISFLGDTNEKDYNRKWNRKSIPTFSQQSL